MALPDCIQRIVDEAEAAAKVVARFGISRHMHAAINGYGLICNNNIDVTKLEGSGLRLYIGEAKNGRGIIRIERDD